jgi:hypothetical protein
LRQQQQQQQQSSGRRRRRRTTANAAAAGGGDTASTQVAVVGDLPAAARGPRAVVAVIDHTKASVRAVSWALTNIYREGDVLHLLHVVPAAAALANGLTQHAAEFDASDDDAGADLLERARAGIERVFVERVRISMGEEVLCGDCITQAKQASQLKQTQNTQLNNKFINKNTVRRRRRGRRGGRRRRAALRRRRRVLRPHLTAGRGAARGGGGDARAAPDAVRVLVFPPRVAAGGGALPRADGAHPVTRARGASGSELFF